MSINAETRFYLTKGIMTLEESKKLDNDREFLDYSLLIGDSTEDQLYKQIEVEIDIFHKCLAIIKKENQNDKHTKLLLLMLFDRINNMFAYMFYLFPINVERAMKYVQFCLNHLSLIFPHRS
ncbi:uncharacterized protein LOC132936864 isoform X1 [Metopolophium dirhodum]|uniref:uncharacterized protein LOC132936864 isoform X1 n=1 Tax=Metopolophium dirhodum TaxID=44670 RepID=UPI00298FD7E2|nr:uncharacterized protein LOC132936864 isoform X1 [Metopolophium dirhodum]